MKKTLELLAPAKNLEAGIAAINCGADSVYIGGPQYGARAEAGNSLSDIEKLVQYAHKFWVKVFVTVNTLLTDKELIQVEKLIKGLYKINVDAIIIQDVGLLELDLPPIPLIASTQMHNDCWQKIKFLEDVGIKRVILARELSIQEIKEIKSHTNIELEFFIHGALCVCYSGQCRLSYVNGGRSGNRGVCGQPCRNMYSLKTEDGKVITKNKYLLSLKDLNLSAKLNEVIDAGITCFKIEGRLKDISYVKNITSYYRKKLDNIILNSNYVRTSSGTSNMDLHPDPYKTFNRSYTDYFIEGKKKSIASINTPKSLGEKIGTVKKVNKDFFVLDKPALLSCGDGLCFFNKDQKLCGTNIVKIDNEKIFTNSLNDIIEKVEIYRNHDLSFIKTLKSSNITRKIGIDIFLMDTDNGFTIKAIDEDKNSATFSIETEKNSAKNKTMAHTTIKKQLSKTGNSIFQSENIIISFNSSNGYFIPIKIINQMRRELLKKLEEVRIEKYPIKRSKLMKNDISYPYKELDYSFNILNKKAEEFYLRHRVKKIEYALESVPFHKIKNKKVMTTKYCIRHQLGLCHKSAENNKPLILFDDKKEYRLLFNCKTCTMEIWN